MRYRECKIAKRVVKFYARRDSNPHLFQSSIVSVTMIVPIKPLGCSAAHIQRDIKHVFGFLLGCVRVACFGRFFFCSSIETSNHNSIPSYSHHSSKPSFPSSLISLWHSSFSSLLFTIEWNRLWRCPSVFSLNLFSLFLSLSLSLSLSLFFHIGDTIRVWFIKVSSLPNKIDD